MSIPYAGVHLSGRKCNRRFARASVISDDTRASAAVNLMEIYTMPNDLNFKHLLKIALAPSVLALNIVRECHFARASVVYDDGRACATVDFWLWCIPAYVNLIDAV